MSRYNACWGNFSIHEEHNVTITGPKQTKSTLSMLAIATLSIGAFAPAAQAADFGKITLKNNSDYYMTYTVKSEGWNCNDAPFAACV